MRFAKHSAANTLVQDEMKSVELCQAYILMSIYAVPQRSWDRDQSWLYTGLAVRCVPCPLLFISLTSQQYCDCSMLGSNGKNQPSDPERRT